MYRQNNDLVYSPSDLNAFLDNECVTWLSRFNLEYPGELTANEAAEEDVLIQGAGNEHERTYLAGLVANGADVVVIDREDPGAFLLTLEAMRAGREIIYQARLELNEFAGWADFLFRVDGVSELGSWHYEVWDTKLSRSLKPYFAVQLCCYTQMLEAIQGKRPAEMGIVLGNGARQALRVADYWFYYQALRQAFLDQQRLFDRESAPPFPGLGDYRQWSAHVNQLLSSRDDLSLIANIRTSQIEKLTAAGITSAKMLVLSDRDTVPGMNPATFERLRAQARLQAASEPGRPPAYEHMTSPPDAIRQGFALLPPASSEDVCFDIEGYPLVDGGIEYLLGAVTQDGDELVFRDWWAHNRTEEQASLEGFVDWVYARWKHDPAMHVYHYAAYETTALVRLMGRYASREREIDELLSNHVFVDLYTVVRQALLIGEPAYSLKNVEHLYLLKREGGVATAGDSMVFYHRWLTCRDGADWKTSPILKLIRDYNQADCDSTWFLLRWLRKEQETAGVAYVSTEPPKELAEETVGRAILAREMLASLPVDRSDDPERWRVHELLAHLLEFHRREQKSLYRKRFDRLAMTETERILDPECLGGAERTATAPVPVKKSLIYEYCFPVQESKLHEGSKCLLASDGKTGFTLLSIDYEKQLLTFSRGKNAGPPADRLCLIPNEIIGAQCIVDSLERTAREYQATGRLTPALTDFLRRSSPRIADHPGGPVIVGGQDVSSGAATAILGLDRSTLCIQGPPGCGKTATGGNLIAELLRRGKRVGITSNSHDAICLLMKAAGESADRLGIRFTGAKCGEEDREPPHPAVEIIPTNADVFGLPILPDLVGGTAWVFSLEDACGQFDYLFIDEAGQVSVANLVAMAPSARNLILLGDQMQLGQPILGVHPGESGQSILEYYLQKHVTIPEHLGIFLATTWRMRPEICGFISEAVYNSRLQPEPLTSGRSIRFVGPKQLIHKGAGILHVPVLHSGNIYDCKEEAAAIRELVTELLGHTVEETGTNPRPITRKDIVVVAPFNLQVRMLSKALPGVRVGTVDKFQGQQAPIVIFSMTSSEGDASPRGIEFLFDKQRLNVAISRAQILAILVSSPGLGQTRCSSLEQMRAVNLYCAAVANGVQAPGA
jgi:predicted RecB family nuclease